MNRLLDKITFTLLLSILLSTSVVAQESASISEDQFLNPPPSYKPRTWFHAMSSNMSKPGLTKDIEALADAGIGGMILFNVTHLIPKGKILFNSPEHIDLIAHAATECERLGLSFGVHNCDGWTSSGGPWVTPEHSMKQLVHAHTVVDGGNIKALKLPQPGARGGFYRDVAVLAYPSLPNEIQDAQSQVKITSSDPELDLSLLNDGRADVQTILHGSPDHKQWINFEYEKPFNLASLHISFDKGNREPGYLKLLVSEDGEHFTKVRELKPLRLGKIEYAFDERFEGISARFYKIETTLLMKMMEVTMTSVQLYDQMLARTSLFKVEDHRIKEMTAPRSNMIVASDQIIDLTDKVNNGILTTELDAGKWTIMRFGYTITGAVNGPASSEGRGLEVDKMNKASFKQHYKAYVTNVINASRKVALNALQYIEIDSYEVGGQNWTQGYENQFQEKYGYSILKFLPLYAGRFVDNVNTSERVLWDIRNFNSDLITTNYFDYFTELCHEDGLISYVEPYSFNAPFNELDAGKKVDVPMGEFWMHQRYQAGTAVSSARIYGKNIISAESFSARPEVNWKGHPGSMKLTGDKAWTLGINEFMFHRYAHQANTHVVPGMTMSQFGSHIDRTQTWWNNAGKAWFQYLARGQYLLRQGKPVADLLVFVGEGSPSSIVKRNFTKPQIPNYINFDCINADALINRLSVNNGKLELPDGITYKFLQLYNSSTMSLPTLRKIKELSDGGAIILGSKPTQLGGFSGKEEDHDAFLKLANELWSRENTYTSWEWYEIMNKHQVTPDLVIEGRDDINYIHRQNQTEDIYFFYNPDSTANNFKCTFAVKDMIPELWDPRTGEVTKLAKFRPSDKTTTTWINLPPEAAMFVVFREKNSKVFENSDGSLPYLLHYDSNRKIILESDQNAEGELTLSSGTKSEISIKDIPDPVVIDGPWEVSFHASYDFDTTFAMKRLMDWKDHPSFSIKHFSGTAIYQNTFSLEMLDAQVKAILDLGQVEVAARVKVNNQDLGVLWKYPYAVDITPYLKRGKNKIEIEVTNTWPNRLIGDEYFPNTSGYEMSNDVMPDWYTDNLPPPPSKRKTFTTYDFYDHDDPLIPSGLVGPVQIKYTKSMVVGE